MESASQSLRIASAQESHPMPGRGRPWWRPRHSHWGPLDCVRRSNHSSFRHFCTLSTANDRRFPFKMLFPGGESAEFSGFRSFNSPLSHMATRRRALSTPLGDRLVPEIPAISSAVNPAGSKARRWTGPCPNDLRGRSHQQIQLRKEDGLCICPDWDAALSGVVAASSSKEDVTVLPPLFAEQRRRK